MILIFVATRTKYDRVFSKDVVTNALARISARKYMPLETMPYPTVIKLKIDRNQYSDCLMK